MSEKNLTEAEWKKFAKGRELKDAALLKAFVALDKARDPEQELAALDELEKQVEVSRKASKADKAVVAYLDDLDKSIGKQRKSSEAEAKKAAQAESEAEGEEESPALLTSKMIPLMRQVRKGEVMQALVASTSKGAVVLLSRRTISPTRRKLLAEYLGVTSGVKYVVGDCRFEDNAYTFVVQSPAGGLAKRLKAALLEQTDLRVKVRVRGEDPNDVDDDGEEAPPDDESATAAAATTGAPAAAATPAAAAPAGDPLEAVYAQRMEGLEPRVLQALREGRGDASKLRAVADFARGKSEAGQFKAAVAALDSLAKLVDAAFAAPAAAAGAAAPSEAAADPRLTAFEARRDALKERLKQAIAARNPNAKDIAVKLSDGSALVRRQDFAQAEALLDDAERMLTQTPAAAAAAVAPTAAPATEAADAASDAARTRYEALFEQLEPDYLAAVRTGGADSKDVVDQAGQVRRAWDMASDSAEKEDYARASLILQRLADGGLLKSLLETRRTAGGEGKVKPTGLVARRKFMLERWARIPGEIKAELATLKTELAAQQADGDPAELASAIDANLQALLADLQDDMDTAINAGNTDVFKGLRQRVEQDDLMAHLADAPFMDGSKFKKVTLDAIGEIESAMTA